MASKKQLKKHINRLMFDVIEECSFQIIYFPDAEVEQYEKQIADVVAFRNSLVEKVNGARKADNPGTVLKEASNALGAKATELYKALYA